MVWLSHRPPCLQPGLSPALLSFCICFIWRCILFSFCLCRAGHVFLKRQPRSRGLSRRLTLAMDFVTPGGGQLTLAFLAPSSTSRLCVNSCTSCPGALELPGRGQERAERGREAASSSPWPVNETNQLCTIEPLRARCCCFLQPRSNPRGEGSLALKQPESFLG